MNNFNNVFLALKKHCTEFISTECLEQVAKETNIDRSRLDTYLNTLNDLSLIKYSHKDNLIMFTPLGKSTQEVFNNSLTK